MKNENEVIDLVEALKEQSGGKSIVTIQVASNLSGISQMSLRRAIWGRDLAASQPNGNNSKYIITLKNLAKYLLGQTKA